MFVPAVAIEHVWLPRMRAKLYEVFLALCGYLGEREIWLPE
jgi:hypothetical protein